MRILTTLTLSALILPLLACGGVFGPSVQPHTAALCDHLSETNDAPCSAVPFAEAVPFGGLEVRVVSVETISAGSAASTEERQAMRATGGSALAVIVEVHNPGPVKATHDFGVSLYTADGELRLGSPGAAASYGRANGVPTAFDVGGIGPGRSKQVAHVFAVPPSELGDATLSFQKVEYKADPDDPRGRRRNFVVDQALIELPLASPALL